MRLLANEYSLQIAARYSLLFLLRIYLPNMNFLERHFLRWAFPEDRTQVKVNISELI
jgi:hypothetical protein